MELPIGKLKAVQTNEVRDLYKAQGIEYLYDYQMRECAIDAERWRNRTSSHRRPGGVGEPFTVLPRIVVDGLRASNQAIYEEDPRTFWCHLWHRFPKHRCRDGVCPKCGRS